MRFYNDEAKYNAFKADTLQPHTSASAGSGRASDRSRAMTRRHHRQWRDYRTPAGARPVKEFLAKLSDEEVAAISAGMREVRQRGTAAARHLRDDIYEVRADAATRSFRLLFSCEGKYSQVLLSLSVYEKRTQKAPTQEIDLAKKRLKDWRKRTKN